MSHVRSNSKTQSYRSHPHTRTAILSGLFVVSSLLAGQSCEAQSIVDDYLFDPALGIDGDVIYVYGTEDEDQVRVSEYPNPDWENYILVEILDLDENLLALEYCYTPQDETVIVEPYGGYDGFSNSTAFREVVYGGIGDDTMYGGNGPSFFYGEGGEDFLLGGFRNDTIDGGDHTDTVNGECGNDIVGGGAGNDFVYGFEGNDWVFGGPGIDTVDGGDGNDFLQGDTGIDTLNGNNDNDILIGGLDTGADNMQDFLSGNQGADQFRVDLKYTKILVNGKWISVPSPEDSLLDFSAAAGDTTFS